jgi:hypothetical protein
MMRQPYRHLYKPILLISTVLTLAFGIDLHGQAPEFLVHPKAVTASPENDVYLSFSVKSFIPLTTTWLKNGQPVEPPSGQTNYKVTIAGVYSVLASNACGVAISAEAAVTFRDQLAPIIYQQPQDLVSSEGYAMTLRVGAYGSLPLSFQWRKDGVEFQDQTYPSLLLAHATNSGSYDVIVTNMYGAATSRTAVVSITGYRDPLPTIVYQPRHQTVLPGTDVSFDVTIGQIDGEVTYQWWKGDKPLIGQTNRMMLLRNVAEADAGSYFAEITSPGGSTKTRPAILTIVPPGESSFLGKPFVTVLGPLIPSSPTNVPVRFVTSATLDRSVITFSRDVRDIHQYRDGQLRLLTQGNTTVDGRPFTFSGFERLSADGDDLVFVGSYGRSTSGVFRIDNSGTITRLIPADLKVPGKPDLTFTRFGPMIHRNGVTVCVGFFGNPESQGLYRWDGKEMIVIADDTIRADCSGAVRFIGALDFDGANIAFQGTTSGGSSGVFASFNGGPVTNITATGNSLNGTTNRQVSVRGDEVAFVINDGVVVYSKGTSKLIVPRDQTLPGLGPVAQFGVAGTFLLTTWRGVKLIGPETLLFSASGPSGTGLFLWRDQQITPVALPLTQFNGRTAQTISLMDGNDQDLLILITDTSSLQLLASTSSATAQQPDLSFIREGSGLRLSWIGNYALQFSTDLINWIDTNAISPVTVELGGTTNGFYRLRSVGSQ